MPSKTAEGFRSEAEQVLEILNRWDQKMQGHQTQKRGQDRLAFPLRVVVYPQDGPRHSAKTGQGLTVLARNVSPKGIGFIYKGRIQAKRLVLCLNPDSGATTWFHAEIVRSRPVHSEFWDYGAKFTGRATQEQALCRDNQPTVAAAAN